MQLLAEGPSGPRPIAELTLGDAVQAQPMASDAGAGAARIDVLARLAQLRRSEGLPALRDNRLLAESAQRHAAKLAKSGTLAHVVADEDPEARLLREHVAARTVGEVLASADGTEAAWQALLQSPSHRMTVSRRDFTDVGVGQAKDARGRVWLVVVFASWPRRTP